jgi:(p)ppGpp synthase/HD superfamily hydrolase
MQNSSTDNKMLKAFILAFEAHSSQFRKGTSIPYIVHPMDVASILLKNMAPENVVIAGLLHDVVEDTNTPIQSIAEAFGEEVADLVQQASEPPELLSDDDAVKRETWKARKMDTISRLKSYDVNAKLLSCADKLSNIRDMIGEQKLMGDVFWGKFNASKSEQFWYYHSILDAYSDSPPDITGKPAFSQFKEAVMTLFPDS